MTEWSAPRRLLRRKVRVKKLLVPAVVAAQGVAGAFTILAVGHSLLAALIFGMTGIVTSMVIAEHTTAEPVQLGPDGYEEEP